MRTRVMGILNVTPDSFSDGGDWVDPAIAVAHGLALAGEGADIVDVGGESTRPGAQRPSVETELARVLPVVAALTRDGVSVSVDTMRAEVAAQSVAHGAALINDVSGGLADPDMLPTVAGLGVPYIAMHWRAHSTAMNDRARYDDVVTEVCAELAERRDAALAAGIAPGNLILDPGLGFAKTPDHNWTLLGHLEQVVALGHPVLLGASRKRFLGELLATDGAQRPPKQRDDASLALTVLAAQRGLWGVRTHTVRAHRDAIAVIARLAGEDA